MSAATVVPDTGEVTVLMTAEEAEEKTLKAQSYMGMVCVLVKELHDKQAWRALGYPSWTAYCKDRFNVGKSRSYQLIGYAETIALGTKATGLPESTIVDSLPEGVARGIDRSELAELLDEAYANLPADTPINTRRDLFDALIDQIVPKADHADDADESPEIPTPDAGAPASPAPVSDPTPDVQADAPTAPSGEPEGTSTPPAQGSDPVDSSSADGDQTDDDGGAGAFPAHAPVVVHPTRPTIVPRSDDGSPSVADLLDWWPANGQWRTATAELGTEDSAFGRFMDLREPRDSEDPTELAKTCPAALRPGAAKAARIAAQHFIETAEALERPTPLTIVEEA